jgi:hypothetical protein
MIVPVQVSRFDKWNDLQGVIDAFQIAPKQIDCTLVLVGNIATDDPEGQDIFAALCRGVAIRHVRQRAWVITQRRPNART